MSKNCARISPVRANFWPTISFISRCKTESDHRLFIGGLLPFIFTAFSMDAVGKRPAVVREVRRQLQAQPGILRGKINRITAPAWIS